ncbi:receptor-like protein EIX1 [Vitis vinifera]|uniref:receptor-like protein EIX1 n=1 Tax=Vitis vinifera TaxID=29760 RepID=UPI001FC576A7|nr:receptor-like protein EIX1 [Vitis vinifera]
MSYAGISSVIPAWFWTRSLSTVDLSHNQIIGSIPSLHFSSINLGSNNFTDPLPQISSDVERLDLSNNLFCGSLSPMLCRRTDKEVNLLESLDISGNLLSGELPNCWMYWRELTMLKLGNNNLTGHIPSSMGSLIWLGSLHLRNNHLSGNYPLPLKNCSSLVVLDLSKNEFTGTIPAWMGNFNGKFIEILPGDGEITYTPGLMVLVLHSNKFNGSIPLELCHLHSLQILDLGNNNLSGTIPRCFGNFSSMIKQSNSSSPFPFHNERYFESGSTDTATLVMKGVEYEYSNILGLLAGMDLSSNKLSGEIPEELTGLHGLVFLNLSNNHLQGKIPVKIGAMTSMESLDLSMNRLSGVIPQGMAKISFLSHLNLSYNNLRT